MYNGGAEHHDNFCGFSHWEEPICTCARSFLSSRTSCLRSRIVRKLKVTLHLFWLLAKKQEQPRCISDRELQQDQLLLRSSGV